MSNYWKRRGSEWVRIAERICRCRVCGRDTWPRQPMYEVRTELGNELSIPSIYLCADHLDQHFQPSLFGG
jgi:hypothetical protein